MEKKKTILIVEDEPLNRRILKKFLEREYDIVEAGNGLEGWQLLGGGGISAVLLDVVMPVMNGYEFLEHVRAKGMTNIPIIVTTGAADSESEKKVLSAGAWDFVTKPYNPDVLLRRLKNAIARSEVALYEQMQRMAAHDPLTGLHNRGRMFEQTRQMLDENPDKQFAFLRFDIDRFALFNTSFGEDEGNQLLIYLARCLRAMAQTVEMCKFCRMNSDVFCACFTYDGDPRHLQSYVDTMQEQLSNYKKDYLLSLSVGACLVTDQHLSVDDLYFRATVAARKCKNQFETHLAFYDAASGERLAAEVEIQNEMQTALDEEQFVVYLQPKFTVMTETICGAEALVRWKHPQRGMVSPGVFIPVFEKNGFISKLDYYVWDHTCAMLKKWTDGGRRIYPVSVNISRISLYNPRLTALLTGLVQKYGVDPALLQLEITESAYMSDPELMEETIRSLHEAGFTILMDDFGSGYSSLNTLKRIYIDVLKIDMKFLPIENETERGEIILACVIKMANLLGMSVVTEGVETRQQRDFLEVAGCESIQGYYYSRPIPQSEYEEKYIDVEAPAPVPGPQETAPERLRVAEVLVIDDSEVDREVLYQNLKDHYQVHMCADGEAGLAYLKRNMGRVKLVLVDNLMPGMSGLEFLKYCRMDSALGSIPKIMITADGSVGYQVKAFEAGAYDYIEKPLVKEILMARVEHVMELSNRMFLYDSVASDRAHFGEHDVMTGLLNKIAFQEIVDRILHIDADATSALLVIDVDNFKGVNDEFGHAVGDKVLIAIAHELQNTFRKTDIIGRFGGDEFVVLMTQLPDSHVARKKAEEIIKSVLFRCLKQLNVSASVSVGIAISGDRDTQLSLFEKADQALYEAKRTGKAKAVIYGERVPPIRDDDRPIILICSEDPQVYPAIALAYGEGADFANITSFDALRQAFASYKSRIRTICLDMQKKRMEDSDAFYRFLVENGAGEEIPILAFCQDGNLQQMRDALELQITDLLSLPPHIDILQHKIAAAIMKADVARMTPGQTRSEGRECP